MPNPQIRINGFEKNLPKIHASLLLDFVREHLQMHGTKKG